MARESDNPRKGAALSGFLEDLKRKQQLRREAMFQDNGVGSLLDGYNKKDVPRISSFFLSQNNQVGLRSRLDFLLGHSMMGRSEDKRRALLSNIFLYELDDEGTFNGFVCTTIIIYLIHKF